MANNADPDQTVPTVLLCALIVSDVTFVLSLFVPYLFFFWCLGKAVLRDYRISWVSSLIFLHCLHVTFFFSEKFVTEMLGVLPYRFNNKKELHLSTLAHWATVTIKDSKPSLTKLSVFRFKNQYCRFKTKPRYVSSILLSKATFPVVFFLCRGPP